MEKEVQGRRRHSATSCKEKRELRHGGCFLFFPLLSILKTLVDPLRERRILLNDLKNVLFAHNKKKKRNIGCAIYLHA